MSAKYTFDKRTADKYLFAVAKEYRKHMGNKKLHHYSRAEIIIVGGASVMFNYNFRDTTGDIDALIFSDSSMKEAINKVTDEYGLPNGWLNSIMVP